MLEHHFSIVGDDGMSKEPQSGVLVKESESVYTLWCTGRQCCEGMLVELKVKLTTIETVFLNFGKSIKL